MDRFKFRVWDGSRLHNECQINGDGYKRHIGGFHSEPAIWMQCTGEKDRSKKLMFEGDVIEFYNGEYVLGQIVFQQGSFCFKCSKVKTPLRYFKKTQLTILGNIYENPELLKGAF